MNSGDWKKLIANVAPALATALGGPLAGAATAAIGNAVLGKEDATEQDIAEALSCTTPDALLKLREADHKFKQDMARVGVDLEKIAADDRDSARKRQVGMRDWTPNVLAGGLLLAWLIVQYALFNNTIPDGNEKFLLRAMGTMDTLLGLSFAFFFGSSVGSKRKTELMGVER